MDAISGFISVLKNCLLADPYLNHIQLSQRLQLLGWDDFELDFHTLQLAIACFEAEGTKGAGTRLSFCEAIKSKQGTHLSS